MKVVLNRDGTGKVVYNSEIIRDIVDCALSEVDGVIRFAQGSKQRKNAIQIDVLNDGIVIDVSVKLIYTVNVSDVAGEIQHTIKKILETMTEFKISAVNVHVVEVEFNNEEQQK